MKVILRGVGQVVLVLGGIIGALLLLEIGARLVPPADPDLGFDDYGDLFTCSPALGWRGTPGYQGDYTREEFSHPIALNAAGHFDQEYPLDKPADTVRILWVGDSYAQAVQVEQEHTAQHHLEVLLNQRLGHTGRTFEVINTGVIGWGTGQQLAYYREVGHQYQADVVLLLMYLGNDVRENLPGHGLTVHGRNCFAPYFPVCADGSLDVEPWPYVPGVDPAWHSCDPAHRQLSHALAWIKQHSLLFAHLEPLLIAWQPRRDYGADFGLRYTPMYLPDPPEEVTYAWRVTEGLLAQFNREVNAEGAQFAVATIGPKAVVQIALLDESQQQYILDTQPVFAEADIDKPNRRIAAFMTQHNVPTLDLQTPMVAYMRQTGAQLYYNIDRHWTVDGNRVVAELLLAWLLETNLIPTEANSP